MPVRQFVRRFVVGSALAVGAVITSVALVPTAGAADFGNVWTVADADYSCSAQTVSVLPMTNETIDYGTVFQVYALVSVYDYNYGGWIQEPNWVLVDGITTHVFYGITNPYAYAYVTYAMNSGSGWVMASDWVSIQSDLDNYATFCDATGF